ncbi:MAG: LamG-like jellyroll fold domain-containing protein [Acidimicrobiales bacterium]
MSGSARYAAARSAVLTLGATVGVACLLWTIGLGVFGLRALVVLSGSMAPALDVGDVGFARTVSADRVEIGDIVSVTTETGTRVTHRVIAVTPDNTAVTPDNTAVTPDNTAVTPDNTAVTPDNTAVTLRLRGDANGSPDAGDYTVTRVDRVVGHVPVLGYLLLWASSPWGMAAGGGLLVACLVVGWRERSEGAGTGGDDRPDDDASVPPGAGGTGRRDAAAYLLAVVAAIPAVLAGTVAAPVTGTVAYFSDTPKLASPAGSLDAAQWFTCAQAMSSAAYGSQPWAHLSFDENTGLPQSSEANAYFQDSIADWDGVYFVGSSATAVTPAAGNSGACRRDGLSRSVKLVQSSSTADLQYVRHKTASQSSNGPAGARWITFSVNVWFKTDHVTGADKAGVLAAFSPSLNVEVTATDRILYLDSAGHVTFEVFPGAQRFRTTTVDYADNQWHMATMTLGSAGQCLYVDGLLAGTCDATVTSAYQAATPTYWRFGYAYLSNGFLGITDGDIQQRSFQGYLDDASIWTRQLGATEIRDIFRAGLPLMP